MATYETHVCDYETISADLEEEKNQALRNAFFLGYSEEIKTRIKQASSYGDIERAMIAGRMEM